MDFINLNCLRLKVLQVVSAERITTAPECYPQRPQAVLLCSASCCGSVYLSRNSTATCSHRVAL